MQLNGKTKNELSWYVRVEPAKYFASVHLASKAHAKRA